MSPDKVARDELPHLDLHSLPPALGILKNWLGQNFFLQV